MLIVFDIGNTTTGVGLFQGKKLLADWKIKSDREKTADEYGFMLSGLLAHGRFSAQKIKGAIISSVVPPLTPVFQAACEKFFRVKPLVVGPGIKTGIPILYENPAEVGSDRIVVAGAAFEKYGGPCLVVDFGTATTFDVISREGDYLGGAIAPGIATAAESMFYKTAMLPRIEFSQAKKAIGTDTISAMQSGLLFGYVGLVEGLVSRIKSEMSEQPLVVATGGYARLMTSHTPVIDEINPELTLTGIRLIYLMNRT